jgi:hypothetical protein
MDLTGKMEVQMSEGTSKRRESEAVKCKCVPQFPHLSSVPTTQLPQYEED